MKPRVNMKYLEQHVRGALERQAWPLICKLCEERDLLDCGDWCRQKLAKCARSLVDDLNNRLELEARQWGFDTTEWKPLVDWADYRANGLHSAEYYEAEAKKQKVYDIINDRTKELCVKVAMGMGVDELMDAIKDTDFSAVKVAEQKNKNKNKNKKGSK